MLSIDLETYSEVDIRSAGLYRYAENAEILLFAYAFNDEPVEIVDLAQGEKLPARVLEALNDPDELKTAYNAAFEMNVIEHALGIHCDPEHWECTMVAGYMLGLPGGLDLVGKILNIEEQKMSEGKRLIKYFSVPCKPTKTNGGRTRNLPSHEMEKWNTFKEYCKRDVEAERAIRNTLMRLFKDKGHSRLYPPDWKLWALDQHINRAGVLLDMDVVNNAIAIDEAMREDLMQEARDITGLSNPNSRQQVLDWLKERTGREFKTFDKTARAELLQDDTLPADVLRLIEIKNLLGKTSVKKYEAMRGAVCSDGRVRGMLQFYGASRTGRWAGRLVQLHNLPQNHLEDLDTARDLVKSGDYKALALCYDSPSDVLSQLIRTAFVAGEGKRFIVADFSAIEARVIAWLANEKWRQEAFANGEDIYCASASQMFGVPVVKHGINGELRQKGKVAELACIAEGQEVLTDKGLVPIEQVTTDMKLWDGTQWVKHEGIIYKGMREVLTYEGLTATPDHLVWVEGKHRPVYFGIAAASGAHLVQTGDGRNPVRLGKSNQPGETMEQTNESLLRTDSMHRLRFNPVAGIRKLKDWKIKRLSTLLTTKTDTAMARTETDGRKAALREPKGQRVPPLWRKRDKVSVCQCDRGRALPYKALRCSRQETGDRPDRYEWALCTGKSKVCIAPSKLYQSAKKHSIGLLCQVLALCKKCRDTETKGWAHTGADNPGGKEGSTGKAEKLADNSKKVRVYDIRNAGSHHRFTVSGKLVHNCGYGGGVNALKAFGADKMGLSEEEMLRTVKQWREASPNIVKLWGDLEKAAKKAIRNPGTAFGSYIYWNKVLSAKLPSGRYISYIKPRITYEGDKESIDYYGTSASGGWGRCFTWGGKLTENIVQAIARDCLAAAMMNLDKAGYKIVMHVHDEVILEMPYGVGSLKEASKIMGQAIPWAPGLILRADGYETEYYKKD